MDSGLVDHRRLIAVEKCQGAVNKGFRRSEQLRVGAIFTNQLGDTQLDFLAERLGNDFGTIVGAAETHLGSTSTERIRVGAPRTAV